MKLFKIFLELLYSLLTLGIIAVVMWGANYMVNLGGSNVDVPNIVRNINDDEDTIYFSDVSSFFITGIKHAHVDHEIYIDTSNDGSEKLWFIPMGWANRSFTWVKNVAVSVFAPSYEIEQLDKYRHVVYLYGYTLSNEYHYRAATEAEINGGVANGLYFGDIVLYTDPITGYLVPDPTVYPDDETTPETNEYLMVYQKFGNAIIKKDITRQKFDNEMIKIGKYANVDYDQYMKFLNNKPVVKWAFSEVIIMLSLTLYIVYQTPITFRDTEDGAKEISGNILPKIPFPRRRKRKQKKQKE